MRKLLNLSFLLMTSLLLILPMPASAILTIELTQGISGAVPITVEPFHTKDITRLPQPLTSIITSDLQNSGRFKVLNSRDTHVNYMVSGNISKLANGKYEIDFRLLDNLADKVDKTARLNKDKAAQTKEHAAFHEVYTVEEKDLRAAAHHISDLVYKHITGIRGVFSTKIAYVLLQKSAGFTRYILEVADQDGYNPRPLLNSPEPIMSPSWSPNGRDIAYVSFENKRAGIYIQNVVTGSRYLLSRFPGINGAPAWSPDGKSLAIVLSKTGSPNIYTMDIATHHLRQVTNDFYINTEPSFARDGKSLLFTSNRSGGPQIYQVRLANLSISRVSYEGDYNARASYTWDGNHVAMIHRAHDIYSIAILDLDTGTTRILNGRAGDSSSPSIAPNGSMILYDMVSAGRNVLGMVSADGRIQLVLPDRVGDAQDAAWSPFLS